jgi:hypothetical protein
VCCCSTSRSPERDAWLREQMRAESEVDAGGVAGCPWLASMRA